MPSASQKGEEGNRGHAPEGRVEYRHPPISAAQERSLENAYERISGRRVWPRMRPLLILAQRLHGPDVEALLEELHAEHGVKDLLLRLREHPPRVRPVEGADRPTWGPRPPRARPERDIRVCGHPSAAAPTEGPAHERQAGGRPDQLGGDGLFPGLIYGPGDRPSFDGTSTRRYDRRSSNPDARHLIDAEPTDPATVPPPFGEPGR